MDSIKRTLLLLAIALTGLALSGCITNTHRTEGQIRKHTITVLGMQFYESTTDAPAAEDLPY
jgi:predicted small secreted protein